MRLMMAAAVAALCLVAAVPAGAATLNYAGTSAATDNVFPVLPADTAGPTTCAAPAHLGFGAAPSSVHYRLYAFRNASASSDCISIGGITDCASGATFDVSFVFGLGLLGSDDPNGSGC